MDPNGATLPTRAGAQSGAGRHRWVGPAAVLVVSLGVVALLRSVRRVEVVGGSMAPALEPGDRLLVVAPPWGVRPVPGDVVALPDPRVPDRTLVKRVAVVGDPDGTVDVRGDAPDASTDSRTFGPVPVGALLGRAVWRYAPRGRTGPLGRPTGYDRG